MSMPICVDLDGTLIKTDTLWEMLLNIIKSNPWALLLLPLWLLKGRAYFKTRLSQITHIEVANLPYNLELIEWLKQQKIQGQDIYLVTAANQKIADQLASHLDFFTKAFGSSDVINLKGTHKRDFLDQQFGQKKYIYAGDSKADLKVWPHADQAIVVNAKKSVLKQCQQHNNVLKIFSKPSKRIKTWLKAIRVHQYAKNILLFLPLLLDHANFSLSLLLSTILGFISFSLLASSVYILNDLLDLESDRQHHTKSKRAFACGALSIPLGIFSSALFLILALSLSFVLPLDFQILLLIYYAITLLYSFKLKKVVLVDVMTLSTLYTLRILAGMAIAGQGYSSWLTLFSMFFFTSLAFIKRYTELQSNLTFGHQSIHGRGYNTEHIQFISLFGIASGYLSTLVFALYLDSDKALQLYHHPKVLFLVCPIILYWISRIWLKACEGKVHEDPVIYAIRDKLSYALIACILLLAIIASI